jgi:hypothetical protein
MRFFHTVFICAFLCLSSFAPVQAQTFTWLDDEAEASGFDITAQLSKIPVEWSLAQQEEGDGYRLRIAPDGITLSTVQEKKPVVLASRKTPVTAGPIVIQRRGVRWKVIVGNRLLLQAEDDKWSEGKVGYRGGEVKEARLQPVEEITFDDDFMRVAIDVAVKAAIAEPHSGPKIRETKVEETIWRAVSGSWATTGINENEQAVVAQSANPFAFQSKSKGLNLALSGRPFWSDYRVDAAVRPQDAAEVGLAAYAQDAQNYLLFSWDKTGKAQIKEVIAGKEKVLSAASTEVYDDKNWYRLSIAISGETVRALIDDNEVLRTRSEAFGRGLAGLYARNGADSTEAAPAAVFDDVHVRSVNSFYDNFGTAVPGRWQPVTGSWKFQNAALPADSKGAFTVMGESEWHEYSASADVTLPSDAVAGLVVHHVAGEGAYVFRVAGSKAKLPYAGKAQIVKIGGGKSTVLSESVLGTRFDNTTARWSFSSERGFLQGRVQSDGKSVRIIDAFDTSLEGGRAGLYAQRGATGVPSLKNFSIEFPAERKTWAVVPDLYSTDREAQTMGGWSTPEGLWLPAQPVKTGAVSDDKTFWHKGAFWGDGDVRVKLPDLKPGEKLTLLFGNATRSANAPPLKLTLAYDAANLKANLERGTSKLGEGSAKIEGGIKDKPLEVSRRGRFLILRTGPQDEQSTLMVAKVG